MKRTVLILTASALLAQAAVRAEDRQADGAVFEANSARAGAQVVDIQLGSRPYSLIDDMDDGALKTRLAGCRGLQATRTPFSIGHRGAPLQFPEHTLESYVAAARQGAGIVECDVTFTRDRELVCRHSQCDLHTTTNILEFPELAARCSQPFTAYDPASGTPATARCCTSDITLDEFGRLQGKMDFANRRAMTAEEYVSPRDATARGKDFYSRRGTLLTHAQSIRLLAGLGVQMMPELKTPSVAMPYEGEFTQQDFAQKMIDEYKQAGIAADRVWPQSFRLTDLQYWIDHEPQFGRQAVYLDDRVYNWPGFEPALADFKNLKRRGVGIVAPPIFALLELDAGGKIVPSKYARLAKSAGLEIITWSFERSDLRNGAQAKDFYYSSIADAIRREGDSYLALDVLATEVRVRGVFSDWPASVTYYANCMGLR